MFAFGSGIAPSNLASKLEPLGKGGNSVVMAPWRLCIALRERRQAMVTGAS